jgi:predicted nucleic acid-binding protein
VTVLIDSNVLIAVSRGRDEAVLARWSDLSSSDALILFSPVNEAELWAGARPNEYDGLEALFAALVCAPADAAIANDAMLWARKS